MQQEKRNLENSNAIETLSIDQLFLFLLFGLWFLACILAVCGLGNLPLRDFDEGTVARVSYEISQKSGSELLLPSLWGHPYLNKPPGIHWLIASGIRLFSKTGIENQTLPSEFSIRLLPALLSTFIVPLGGLIQFYLSGKDKISSLATAGILLTLLPIARHGRLAMLDGPQLSAIALFWLLLISLDRSKFDRLKAIGIGLSGSAILLLKAPIFFPILIAALIPMYLGKELRNLLKIDTLLFTLMGLLPGIFWHVWNFIHRGQGAFWLWWGDGAGRVLFQAGSGSDLGWRVPLIELLEGGWPWLLLWPCGILWAWNDRTKLWGRWALGTQIILALTILPLRTQLPWYSHILWLPFALLCGPPLAWLIRRNRLNRPPNSIFLNLVPSIWKIIGVSLILFSLLGLSNVIIAFKPYSLLAFIGGIGLTLGGTLLNVNTSKTYRVIGALSVFIGFFIPLLLLMNSPLWLWELNEHWSVIPVANLVDQGKYLEIVVDENFERPSLSWYAGKRIKTLESMPSAQYILTRKKEYIKEFGINNKCEISKTNETWNLLICSNQD